MQSNSFQVFTDFAQRMVLFLERPAVQLQIVAIILSMVITFFLSHGLTLLIKRWADWANEKEAGRRYEYINQALKFLDHVTFPLMGILTLHGTEYIFRQQQWVSGLLLDFILLYWMIVAYRLFIAVMYQFFSEEHFQRYHHRLIAPLFYLFIGSRVLSDFLDLRALAQISIVQLTETPITIGSIFFATVGLYFWVDTIWGVQEISQRVISTRTSWDKGVVEGTLTILGYILVGAGVFVALNSLGLDSTTVAAVTGGLSVGVGFALQDVLKNFLGGIILLFEGTIRPGDVVDIGGKMGVVDKLSIRATTILAVGNNTMVTIPNQDLFSSSLITYTDSKRRLPLVLNIGADYGSNPKEVLKVILDTARYHEAVLTDPSPTAALVNFGDNSIDFVLRVWVGNLNFAIKSELYTMIWEAFDKNGIEIPFPQRDLHLRSGVPWEELSIPHESKLET